MNIDDESQSFDTPQKHNYSDTEPSAKNNASNQVPLGYDLIPGQQNNTTHMTHHKLSSPVK